MTSSGSDLRARNCTKLVDARGVKLWQLFGVEKDIILLSLLRVCVPL